MKNANTLKLIKTAFCLLITMSIVSAQEVSQPQSMGGGGFTIGYGIMDVSTLHSFVPTSIPEFRKEHLLIGGEGHGFIGNLVLGGGGSGIMGDNIKTDSINYNVGGGLGTFDFGYLIVNKDKIKIYPMIGIGGHGYGIKIKRNNNISVSDIVSEPAQELSISNGGFVGDASVTFNFIPALTYDEKKNSYGGFMMGLKVGYAYSFPTSNWRFSGGDVTGGPVFGLNMVYAKLIIGGFGYSKKK